ncbi:hypothetical protein DPMN_134792 [Dreissena polymorpha]|uniref:Uncharacterized protein n=1 Tax=Dreissena polymorpha TaxID=45954 RepID=A0A9D4FXU3_DREPO|nr:hypothetical protein DPMN_134792 [Dreissena polymorpha]
MHKVPKPRSSMVSLVSYTTVLGCRSILQQTLDKIKIYALRPGMRLTDYDIYMK